MVPDMIEADANWWDRMPDKLKADIDEAIKQANNGQGMTHEEVKKKYSKWFVPDLL